jgi:hypothetical protein
MVWPYLVGFVSLLGVLFLLLIAWVRLSVWASRPIVYDVASPAEVGPFIYSWGQWLDERGRIIVRHPASAGEVEFRKRRYRTRPDLLLFRCRNADGGRKIFDRVRASFDGAGIAYEVERTSKRGLPRALVVPLEASDLLTPKTAERLVAVTFGAEGGRFQLSCEGPIRSDSDSPPVELMPYT